MDAGCKEPAAWEQLAVWKGGAAGHNHSHPHRQGCIKFPTTWHSSPSLFLFKSWFSSPKFSSPFPHPQLIFFSTALVLKGRWYCFPFPFFPRYILPHSHDISYSSSLLDILPLKTRINSSLPPRGDKEIYTPLVGTQQIWKIYINI